jgi:hypothetical protein
MLYGDANLAELFDHRQPEVYAMQSRIVDPPEINVWHFHLPGLLRAVLDNVAQYTPQDWLCMPCLTDLIKTNEIAWERYVAKPSAGQSVGQLTNRKGAVLY